MVKSLKVGLPALVAAPFLSVMVASSASAAPDVCNWKTARDAANRGDYAAMCGCTQVTPSFLKRLQARSDFATTLRNTSAQCPGLASLLTDQPTGSIGTAGNPGEDRSNDRAAQADPGNGGGSGSGGGGNPGNGGGPGDGGGPSDGGGPGDGGGDPGNGGGDPGNGGNNGGGNGGNNGGPGNGNGNNGNSGNGGGNNGGSGPGTGNGGSNNGQGNGSGKGGGGHGNGGSNGGGKR